MRGINKIYKVLLFQLIVVQTFAQSGGNNTYDFLNLTNSARVAALGGTQISIYDDDLNFVFHNPSLLNSDMHNHLVLNYVNYFMDINYGYVSYARQYGEIGNFAVGLHYINYGRFTEADESGIRYNTFTAAEYALNMFYSRPILDSLFYIGINVKPLYSQMEHYHSVGIATDIGITYYNPEKLFTSALVVRNIGFQIDRYYPSGARENLPFEIQLGVTQKLQHAPFRFSILLHHLEKFDLTYETEKDIEEKYDEFTGEEIRKSNFDKYLDMTLRHVTIGTELLLSKNFHVRVGYNYKRRQELKLNSKTGTAGFSWGFGLKIYKFHISYGSASYHLAGASNHFSISTNLSEFGKNL